jgi:hypothetical protein
MGEGEQGAAVAQNGFGDPLDHRLHGLDAHLLAQADIVHHVADDLVGLRVHLPGPSHLVCRGNPRRQRRNAGGLSHFLVDLANDFLPRRRVRRVESLLRVDVNLVDARPDDLADHGLVLDCEAAAQDGVRHPFRAQIGDEHAGFELLNAELLRHVRLAARFPERPRWTSPPCCRP